MASDKIKVAVRVRPFNRRELELGTQCVIEMEGQQTILQYPQSPHDKDSAGKKLKRYICISFLAEDRLEVLVRSYSVVQGNARSILVRENKQSSELKPGTSCTTKSIGRNIRRVYMQRAAAAAAACQNTFLPFALSCIGQENTFYF
ncbi:hypothetical protein JYU34_003204 [Plutella xylostella]|uniref:Kinesin motor domain-containing protein n=1 Tax=Plutella xylostella TaxID=51655 RepID=A0ABQ7QZF9_PLUXY|nr:hypothetical protein JYU34_003204 [Plutella xylostella]